MKARFAVDFDGTLVEDDKYPDMGEWIPGAAEAVRSLERVGTVVIYTCRVAPAHHHTEEPRSPEAVEDEINRIRAKLREENLDHLEIWTKPYKPPAVAYIDNRGINFDGDWEATLERVFDLIFPIPGPTKLYRHPNSARFHELLREAGELHDIKQADYGKGDDPFANVRASAEWGMPAWVGAMVRATDKIRRLQTFADRGNLKNESVVDAFMDLAVYALIARVLYEEGS